MPLDKVLEDVLSGVGGGVSGEVLLCVVFGEEGRMLSLFSETSDVMDALLNLSVCLGAVLTLQL